MRFPFAAHTLLTACALALSLTAALSTPARAQDAAPAAAAAAPVDPASIAAAVELMEVTGSAKNFDNMVAMLRTHVGGNAGDGPAAKAKADAFDGLMGKFAAFHNYRARINGDYEGFLDTTTEGVRPNGAYIPRFRNVFKQETDFLRGYAAGIYTQRNHTHDRDAMGEDLKNSLNANKWADNWSINSHIMGETIPKESNFIALDKTQLDAFGMPKLKISIDYDQNDEKMIKDYFEQLTEMFTIAGVKNIKIHDTQQAPGLDIHEMGGVRMGKDPKTSLLNANNQLHLCKNVFVTDGACMTSTSTQNPSLTYMALTARAVDYAVKALKKRDL